MYNRSICKYRRNKNRIKNKRNVTFLIELIISATASGVSFLFVLWFDFVYLFLCLHNVDSYKHSNQKADSQRHNEYKTKCIQMNKAWPAGLAVHTFVRLLIFYD